MVQHAPPGSELKEVFSWQSYKSRFRRLLKLEVAPNEAAEGPKADIPLSLEGMLVFANL